MQLKVRRSKEQVSVTKHRLRAAFSIASERVPQQWRSQGEPHNISLKLTPYCGFGSWEGRLPGFASRW